VERKGALIARQWNGKHVCTATNTDATIEDVVYCMWPLLGNSTHIRGTGMEKEIEICATNITNKTKCKSTTAKKWKNL
jgi:hypothetical protein